MPLTRAIIRAYNTTTQLASIEILEGPRALQPLVPFAASFDPRHRDVGQEVLVENYQDQGPVIIAPWHILRQGNLQDMAYDDTARTFNTASWVAYTGLQLTVTLIEASYLWHYTNINQQASNAAALSSSWRISCSDSVATYPLEICCPASTYRMPVIIAQRTGPHAAGTITLDVECNVYNPGHSITAQYSTHGYIAIPAE